MKPAPQTDLFGFRPPPHAPYGGSPGHRGVSTQIAAADKIKPVTGRLHKLIMTDIDQQGPATRQEISDRTGLKLQTVCGRVRELVLAGKLKDTDEVRGGGRVVSG